MKTLPIVSLTLLAVAAGLGILWLAAKIKAESESAKNEAFYKRIRDQYGPDVIFN